MNAIGLGLIIFFINHLTGVFILPTALFIIITILMGVHIIADFVYKYKNGKEK